MIPILNQMNPVDPVMPYFLKNLFNIILTFIQKVGEETKELFPTPHLHLDLPSGSSFQYDVDQFCLHLSNKRIASHS